jgi:hypothetical protein
MNALLSYRHTVHGQTAVPFPWFNSITNLGGVPIRIEWNWDRDSGQAHARDSWDGGRSFFLPPADRCDRPIHGDQPPPLPVQPTAADASPNTIWRRAERRRFRLCFSEPLDGGGRRPWAGQDHTNLMASSCSSEDSDSINLSTIRPVKQGLVSKWLHLLGSLYLGADRDAVSVVLYLGHRGDSFDAADQDESWHWVVRTSQRKWMYCHCTSNARMM